MASIQKHGDKWRVFFFRDGVRKSKVCRTKTEAKVWAEQVGVEVESGQHGASVNLHYALERYKNEVSPNHKGHRWEAIRIDKLKRELKDKKLSDVTTSDIAEWRDSKNIGPSSIIRELAILNAVFEHCRKEWGYLTKNVIKDVKRPVSPPARRRGVSEAEIKAICEGLNYSDELPVVQKKQEIAIAFLLAIETGMRLGEMLALTKEDIHLERRFVQLEATKNGDRRQVPLSSRAVFLLKRLPEGVFTVGASSADTMFRQVRPEGLHFHDSRSEGITRLAKKLDVLDLARVIGHRDPRSLMMYYRETAEQIAAKLD